MKAGTYNSIQLKARNYLDAVFCVRLKISDIKRLCVLIGDVVSKWFSDHISSFVDFLNVYLEAPDQAVSVAV